MRAEEILRELVAIPTPSTVSNLPLIQWVSEFLGPLGWLIQVLPYTDEAGVKKANLLAWLRPASGAGELPEHFAVAFVCHTDTVPFAAAWDGALRLEERDGNLHGCGSCDVKGALACFLEAVSVAPASDVLLMLTADEEVGCKGMDRLLAGIHLRVGSAIISEPTSLHPGVAGKGYGLARVTVMGREAHSAFPGQGVSAISAAARLIALIEDALSLGGAADELFDPPRTTVNIGTIEGGSAKNIVAGRCTFLVEWRAVPEDEPGSVLMRLRELAVYAEAQQPHIVIAVDGLRDEAGFSPAHSGPLRRQLAQLLPAKPTGISFGSEASRVARIADEVVVIGPGDMRTAHSDRECVPVAELDAWSQVLAKLFADNAKAFSGVS